MSLPLRVFNLLFWMQFINYSLVKGRCENDEEFQCQFSGACIDKKFVCDGTKDCAGGSDETQDLCLFRSCSKRLDYGIDHRLIDVSEASSFRCGYGACIPKLFVCNGLINCVDGSDESERYCLNIECSKKQFKCKYGACIKLAYKCNGQRDCADGSDETEELCRKSKKRCRIREFRCSYGACTKSRYVCNGRVDCIDESDERPSLCGENHTYRPRKQYIYDFPLISTTEEALKAYPKPVELQPEAVANVDDFLNFLNPEDAKEVAFHLGRVPVKTRVGSGEMRFCSIRTSKENTVVVLSCGANHPSAKNCILEEKVPAFSIILAECWGTTTMVLVCQPNGQWISYTGDSSMKPNDEICQPSALSSQICGRYQYLKEPSPWNQTYRWPFLVGIFENNKFICTGTIISSQWILTAAHCFPSFGKDDFKISNFKIQLSSTHGVYNITSLSNIYIHPYFEMKLAPRGLESDVALLKTSDKLTFSRSLFPACVDTEETILGHYAATFIRKEDEIEFSWGLTRQELDVHCFNRESECSKHLEIGDRQFCSRNLDDPVELKPRVDGTFELEPGSSGGPFLMNKVGDNDDKWTVAGIVSYHLDTKNCPSYIVFSSVSQHRMWIEKCVNKGLCL